MTISVSHSMNRCLSTNKKILSMQASLGCQRLTVSVKELKLNHNVAGHTF